MALPTGMPDQPGHCSPISIACPPAKSFRAKSIMAWRSYRADGTWASVNHYLVLQDRDGAVPIFAWTCRNRRLVEYSKSTTASAAAFSSCCLNYATNTASWFLRKRFKTGF
jgi:hypothetical protein